MTRPPASPIAASLRAEPGGLGPLGVWHRTPGAGGGQRECQVDRGLGPLQRSVVVGGLVANALVQVVARQAGGDLAR